MGSAVLRECRRTAVGVENSAFKRHICRGVEMSVKEYVSLFQEGWICRRIDVSMRKEKGMSVDVRHRKIG